MKQPSQEDLLGYVLGALDAQEERDLQTIIDANPEIEDELLELRHSMLPLESLAGGERGAPRPGLARRTCEFIANIEREPQHSLAEFSAIDAIDLGIDPADLGPVAEQAALAPAVSHSRFSSFTDRFVHTRSWSRVDMLAAVAMAAIFACILFPAISHSRFQSRVVACQQNLGEVGTAMLVYADLHQGQFFNPTDADITSNATSLVAPVLKTGGFIEDDAMFTCAGRSDANPARIPTLQQLRNAKGEQLSSLRKRMGGDFGYSLGFVDGDRYHAPQNNGSSHTVLIADMPSSSMPGRSSANHGGNGQNCFFADGHVDFIPTPTIGDDAIYENDLGIVGPGVSEQDNVIAPSNLPAVRVKYEMLIQ